MSLNEHKIAMDKKYQDPVILIFFKVIILAVLIIPLIASVGYIAVQKLKIYYFFYALIYGQLAIIFAKLIFESSKRNFILDIKENKIEPILYFKYEQTEWNIFLKRVLRKKVKKNTIISIVISFCSIVLIIVGYQLNNDGEFALAVGYNLLIISLLWGLSAYFFIIYELQRALKSETKEIQCFKYGLVLTSNYFVLKTFNYMINVSIEKENKEMNICFTDETRGTNDDGNDINVITKTHILIPKKKMKDSDKIYIKAFKNLM